MESRENWRRLQLLTRGQPLLIYTWHSRLQSMPEPYQLKKGRIVTRTDTTEQFLCGFMPQGSKRSMAHRSTAFTFFSCCSFYLLCICIKSTQLVHKSPARLTDCKLRCQWIVLVILPCALSPSHSKLAWEHQEVADGHKKHHQITTGLAWIMWPWITHPQQTVWLEKSGNIRRMCWSLYEFSNSPC